VIETESSPSLSVTSPVYLLIGILLLFICCSESVSIKLYFFPMPPLDLSLLSNNLYGFLSLSNCIVVHLIIDSDFSTNFFLEDAISLMILLKVLSSFFS